MMTRAQKWIVIIGAIAMACVIIGMFQSPQDYFSSYLVTEFFFLSISLGALGNAMIHSLTGGHWGVALQPIFMPLIRIIPILALLFIPLLFGLHHLYSWVDNKDEVTSTWLSPTAFKIRTIIYLMIWSVLSTRFKNINYSRHISAFGLIIYGVTVSLGSVDWIMSLIPQWYSTGFGLLIGTTQLLVGMSFAIIAYWALHHSEDISDNNHAQLLNDFGNLLLMYVLTWMYLAFTQYLIIWAADLPREISWYVPRLQSNWRWLMLLIVILQFALPFLLLLSRDLKRRLRSLAIIALICLLGQWLYIFQLIIPSIYIKSFHIGTSTLLTTLGIGACWLTALSRYMPITVESKAVFKNHG